jgi:predicted N-acyltransferase
MNFQIDVHSSFKAILPRQWEQLAASRSPYQDLSWYENAPLPGRLRLITARSDGELRAILPLFIVTGPSHYYHSPRELFCGFREQALLESYGRKHGALEEALAARWFPAAISISPYGYRGGVIANEQAADPELFDAVTKAADELCRAEGVQLAAYYYLNEDDDRAWLASLARAGAQLVLSGADCNLPIAWSSIDDYFCALGPRGRRVRAEFRRACRADSGIASHAWQGPRSVLNERTVAVVSGLFATSARRHGETRPPTALYDAVLSSWPGGRVLLTAAQLNEVPRSALLAFVKGKTLFPKFFGTETARGDYFQLTFACLLNWAINARLNQIEYGGGSHKAKLLRGAQLRWLFAALQVYDDDLDARLRDFLPRYESVKKEHFSNLALRYQRDHTPPPLPLTEVSLSGTSASAGGI